MTNELINLLLNMTYITIGAVVLFYIYRFKQYHIDGQIKKNGMFFTWDNPASSANPPNRQYISGHRWTPVEIIKQVSAKNKAKPDSIYVNNFRYFDDFLHDAKIPNFLRKRHESVEYYLEASKLCRSSLIVGSAGSGKTEFIFNILQQDWYDKAVIFGKKFDFEPLCYRGPAFDILVQPKIKDSVIHNFIDEPIEYVFVFLDSLKKSALGDETDIWATTAIQELQRYIQKVRVQAEEDNLSIIEKWKLFLSLYEEAFQEANAKQDKTRQSVMVTVGSIMEPLYILAHRIIEGAPTFTVKDFYDRKEPCKLFLSANDPSIEGLVAATYTVITKYQLSLPNNWNNKPVLHLQDEYNSLKELMPERILIEQREVGRSKLFAVMMGVQDLKADKNISQQLLTNTQYLVVFGGTDSNTLDTISEQIGDVVYENLKENESFSSQGKSTSFSTQKETQKLLTNYHINILQEEGFSHLFIALKEKLLFKGYTPRVELRERDYNDFSTINLNKFYKWKLEKEEAGKKLAKTKEENEINALNSIFASKADED